MKHILFFLALWCGWQQAYAQCEGVVPDCTILNDFECQTNYIGLPAVPNPNPTGINTSGNVGEHEDLPPAFDAIIVNYQGPIDLSVYNILKIKVYTTEATSGDLIAKLEGGSSSPVEMNSPITLGAWTEYTFDFSSQANEDHTVLALIFNAGATTGGFYYIDDIRWTDDGSAGDPCSGVTEDPLILNDFECQINRPFSSCFPIVDNPNTGGINTSDKVGCFTDTGGPFDNILIDYDSPIDLASASIFKILVQTSVTGPLLAKLEGGSSTPVERTETVTSSTDWQEVVFDFSSEAMADHTQLVLFFNAGNDGTGDKYFLDDLQFVAALPVQLTEFTARTEARNVVLHWATSQEENAESFQIEHQHAGHWEKVGTVAAKGNSDEATSYTFTHSGPVPGSNVYRLKMIDQDGSFEYSAMRQVWVNGTDRQLAVYPNPFERELQFSLGLANEDVADIQLVDAFGRIVFRSEAIVTAGQQATSLPGLPELAPGIYTLRVLIGNTVFSEAIVRR